MKILSLDGGGCFGIGQANVLASCSVDKFGAYAGASIGAAVAAALAFGRDPKDLQEFFHKEMPKIFKGYRLAPYKVWRTKYNDAALNKALQELLPYQFGAAHKPLLVATVNLGARRLKVFNSTDASDGAWPAWEVVRASVAAPTYFPPWKGYTDGGVFANNPSMVAIAAISKSQGVPITDMEVCSIGTGLSNGGSKIPTVKWGLAKWGLWLVDALLAGASNSMHEYFVESMPVAKHLRVQFVRHDKWRMDSPADMLKAEKAWAAQAEDAAVAVDNF